MARFRIASEIDGRRGYRRVRGDFSAFADDLDLANRPIGVLVLNCCVTETKETRCFSNASIIRAKSSSDRLSRLTL